MTSRFRKDGKCRVINSMTINQRRGGRGEHHDEENKDIGGASKA